MSPVSSSMKEKETYNNKTQTQQIIIANLNVTTNEAIDLFTSQSPDIDTCSWDSS